MATLAMPRDLRSQSGWGVQMSPRRSNLVDVKVISPRDWAIIEVVELEEPVVLEIEIEGEVNLTDHSLQVCLVFIAPFLGIVIRIRL